YLTIINTYLFFYYATATTAHYSLSLHDALPISWIAYIHRVQALCGELVVDDSAQFNDSVVARTQVPAGWQATESLNCAESSTTRSEEHTSELQSRGHLVCRLLLEKKIEK